MMIAQNIVSLFLQMNVRILIIYFSIDSFIDLVGGDQPIDETIPLKSLRQLSGRILNIYIRYKERGDMDFDHVRVYPGILKYVHLINEIDVIYFGFFRTHDFFKVIRVTSSSTTSEVIAKALADFGLHNVKAEKYSLVEVSLISNVNYTDRILEPNEYPLHVLRQQRKVRSMIFPFSSFIFIRSFRNLFVVIV